MLWFLFHNSIKIKLCECVFLHCKAEGRNNQHRKRWNEGKAATVRRTNKGKRVRIENKERK